MTKLFKVLRVVDGAVYSPFKNFYYGTISSLVGKKMTCDNFDKNRTKDCAPGFYATGIDGLIYSLNRNPENEVFEVEMEGDSVIYDTYKQRWETQTVVRQLEKEDVKALVKEYSDTIAWDYYHACFPTNPLSLDTPFDKGQAHGLLRQWASVRDSVWHSVRASVRASVRTSVRDSVWHSVWDSVGDSVWHSVRASVGVSVWDSVWDSVGAYVSSFFPYIRNWKGVNHEEGKNPFQSAIDLWHMGLIPSFDGNMWRLHKGSKAEIVLELSAKEVDE